MLEAQKKLVEIMFQKFDIAADLDIDDELTVAAYGETPIAKRVMLAFPGCEVLSAGTSYEDGLKPAYWIKFKP